MNTVVAMKQIPDLKQLRIRDRKPVLDDVPKTFGDLDKNALEAAVKLHEGGEGMVLLASVGDADLEDTAKEALAGGAHEAYLAADGKFAANTSLQNAVLLAALIKKIPDCGLILFGEGSGDGYSGQVAARTAELLGLPQVGYATGIELLGNKAKVTRALEDCVEVIEVELPAVVTVTAAINEPRIPSVMQILKAGKKPKQVFSAADLGAEAPAAEIATLSNLSPETERRQITVKTVAELVEKLKAEGLVGR